MRIQFLTSNNSWINLKKKDRVKKFLKQFTNRVSLINSHKEIKKKNDILIILSYFKIIPKKFLKISKHNVVVHESDLPKGKGYSPLSWQILEGKTKIIFTLFEASPKVDSGKYYQKKKFHFKKDMFFNEIKNMQLECSLSMLSNFIKKFKDKTEVPILLNTSFNDREPIVETPKHAIDCFLGTDIDHVYFYDYGILITKA